jgi:hypothetical protein
MITKCVCDEIAATVFLSHSCIVSLRSDGVKKALGFGAFSGQPDI